jgi:hypothetical protein
VVRQRTLDPPFEGSSPSSPAKPVFELVHRQALDVGGEDQQALDVGGEDQVEVDRSAKLWTWPFAIRMDSMTLARRRSTGGTGIGSGGYRRVKVRWVTPLGELTDSTRKRSSIASSPCHRCSPRPSTMGTITRCIWSMRSAARN